MVEIGGGGAKLTCLLIIMFLNRLPMYSEAKLAFIVYLWYPKTRVWCSVLFYFWNLLFSILFVILSCSQGTAYAYRVLFNLSHIHILLPWFVCNKVLFQGTAYVYESFFKPYIAKHETEIDRNLLELRTRAGDMTVLYFQKVANYVQTRSYEILQYIASQSQSPTPRPQVLFSCLPFVSGIIIILAARIVTHDI
jgi:receptor expression-enhancing protein 1/2/3/4